LIFVAHVDERNRLERNTLAVERWPDVSRTVFARKSRDSGELKKDDQMNVKSDNPNVKISAHGVCRVGR